MLYPTLNQPLVLISMIAVGFISGFIIDLGRIFATLLGKLKLARHFFDFLAVLLSFFLVTFVNLKVNYGQFRLYVFAVFFISLILERILSKFLWTKLLSKCYTSMEKVKNKFAKRIKIGRKEEK